jgi:outer membrane protein OmpA-like peptidoglycan-associated protein
MSAAGRLGDPGQTPLDAHGCPACPHPQPTGPAIIGSPTVFVNKRPALRKDDTGVHAACCGTNTWSATAGSLTVFINERAAHRVNDLQRHCGGVGRLIAGSPNVMIGETTSAGAGGGGASSTAASGASGGSPGGGGAAPAGGAGSGGAPDASDPATDPADPADPGDPADPADPAEAVAPDQITILVVNVDGKPQPGVEYELTFPDGATTAGKTLPDGSIRRSGLTQHGACPLDFPDVLAAEPAPATQAGRTRFVRGQTSPAIGACTTVELPPRIWRGRLRGLLFDTDKTFLLPQALPGLRNLRLFYDQFPDLSVLVDGHADRAGDAGYNEALSDERARSIAAFLTDAADAWLAHYQGTPHSARWGTREDQHMLSALGHYAGPVGDSTSPEVSAALASFQAEHGLPATGAADPATRRALVTDYMAQDGTSLPPGTPIATHGCGESHPDVATADGVAEQRNRRVEIFLFEGAIDPPPRAPCRSCPEHAIWLARTVLTIDLDQDLARLTVQVIDARGAPVAGADVHAGGPTPRDGVSDARGLCELGEVLPGSYKVIAVKDDIAADRTVTVGAAAPRAELALADTAAAPGGDVVQIQLRAAAPVITRLVGAARPDPRHPLSAPASFVYFGQGELVHVFWELDGDADRLTLQPGGLDVTGTASAILDPATQPPDADGNYTLEASFQGLAAAPARLACAGIVELRLLPSDNPYLTPPARLFDHDGRAEVPAILGRAGSYHQPPFHTGQTWFGECAVRTSLVLAWKVVGAPLIRLTADVEHARGVTGPLRTDVTDRTRAADPITRATGAGQLGFDDDAPILCRVDLAVAREGGGPLGSSVLLVREHIPHPGIADFTALDAGARVAPGATVSAWSRVAFAWTLAGDFAQCALTLTLRDAGNAVLATQAIDPAKDRTGVTVAVAPPPTGRVHATLELRNRAGQLAGPAKQLDLLVPAAPAAAHTLTVLVFSHPSGPATGAKVTAIDRTGANHVGTVDATGRVVFPGVADGDVTVIAERPPSEPVTRSTVVVADRTMTISLDDARPPAYDVKLELGAAKLLRPLIVADDRLGTSKLGFKLTFTERDGAANPTFVELRVVAADGTALFSERFTSGEMLVPGSHDWLWDGYSTAGVLDTALLKQAGVKVEATVGARGARDSVASLTLANKGAELDWIDLRIDRTNHTIAVHVFYVPRLPLVRPVDILDFSMLATRTEEGIARHWSRTITIDHVAYTVESTATIRPAAPTMPIVMTRAIQVGPIEPRSCNPGMFLDMKFVIFFYEPPDPAATPAHRAYLVENHRHTGAHELGHAIVAKTVDATFSARHKGTSTIGGTETGALPWPATGENDLMRYWKDDPAWPRTDPTLWNERRDAHMRSRLTEEDTKTILDFARVALATP